MKVKVLPNDTNIRKNFFLLMIVPLLIGLMISLTSFAHAAWDKKDDVQSPKEQGWKQIRVYQSSSPPQIVDKKS